MCKLTSKTAAESEEQSRLLIIHMKIGELCREIERLPASAWQTDLVSAQAAVGQTVQKKLYAHFYESELKAGDIVSKTGCGNMTILTIEGCRALVESADGKCKKKSWYEDISQLERISEICCAPGNCNCPACIAARRPENT